MPDDQKQASPPSETLIKDLLTALDNVSGLHPGFRPVHAKGRMYSGTFRPAPQAAELSRAPHLTRPTTPVIVRFSDSAGVPTIADNDPQGASPRGIAIRFQLADHVHTDIIGHSFNGFPVHTGEEFLELFRALPLSGPDAPQPTALDRFLGAHPHALHCLTTAKPIPTSLARESFFGVNALKFTNRDGTSTFGRFRVRPVAGNEYLSADDAAKKSPDFLFDEFSERLAKGPVQYQVLVQVAADGDELADASIAWPDSRPEVLLGTVELTQRVDENDPELRKVIFDPIPRVDGIDPSNDPLIEVRSAIYLLSGRRRRAEQ